MTDHPQTATERFLRHGVAGGWNPWKYGFARMETRAHQMRLEGENLYLDCEVYSLPHPRSGLAMVHDWQPSRTFFVHVSQPLMDPDLWRAAGRSIGWSQGGIGVCGNCGGRTAKNCQCPDDVWYVLEEPQYQMRGLVDWLWDHPGDVEGYLATLLDAKETK